ncbi:hypothetical protein [Spirochaeta cellobiosiphila]|uniref:hypothetical protein n=1 Tax=Spirochaeta cellobiosiphila TaxID=504483 RepID=UPI00041E76C9|nr:hypothetical protein [Spirochaeta cellobiosiphila]
MLKLEIIILCLIAFSPCIFSDDYIPTETFFVQQDIVIPYIDSQDNYSFITSNQLNFSINNKNWFSTFFYNWNEIAVTENDLIKNVDSTKIKYTDESIGILLGYTLNTGITLYAGVDLDSNFSFGSSFEYKDTFFGFKLVDSIQNYSLEIDYPDDNSFDLSGRLSRRSFESNISNDKFTIENKILWGDLEIDEPSWRSGTEYWAILSDLRIGETNKFIGSFKTLNIEGSASYKGSKYVNWGDHNQITYIHIQQTHKFNSFFCFGPLLDALMFNSNDDLLISSVPFHPLAALYSFKIKKLNWSGITMLGIKNYTSIMNHIELELSLSTSLRNDVFRYENTEWDYYPLIYHYRENNISLLRSFDSLFQLGIAYNVNKHFSIKYNQLVPFSFSNVMSTVFPKGSSSNNNDTNTNTSSEIKDTDRFVFGGAKISVSYSY